METLTQKPLRTLLTGLISVSLGCAAIAQPVTHATRPTDVSFAVELSSTLLAIVPATLEGEQHISEVFIVQEVPEAHLRGLPREMKKGHLVISEGAKTIAMSDGERCWVLGTEADAIALRIERMSADPFWKDQERIAVPVVGIASYDGPWDHAALRDREPLADVRKWLGPRK
jgi:hypothetical protein